MIKFGPSGNSDSFYKEGYDHTEQAAKYVKERGLDCFEYSFGRGVRMSEEKACSIRAAFEKEGVEISVHAPYFINFANPSDEMAAKSYEYVLQSGRMAKLMGAKRVVFHPAAQGKATREEAVALTEERLKILRDYIYMNELQEIKFCPETMGKLAQIGTVEEIAEFCGIDPVYTPCVDFGHVNAREGGSLKTEEDYLARLDVFIGRLGYERMKDLREDNDLRQSDMAKILGLTNQQAYQRYESGKVLIPLPLLIKIAQYFDVSLDYLTGLTNDKRKYW